MVVALHWPLNVISLDVSVAEVSLVSWLLSSLLFCFSLLLSLPFPSVSGQSSPSLPHL